MDGLDSDCDHLFFLSLIIRKLKTMRFDHPFLPLLAHVGVSITDEEDRFAISADVVFLLPKNEEFMSAVLYYSHTIPSIS